MVETFCGKFNSLSDEHSLQCQEMRYTKVTSKKLNTPISDRIAYAAMGSTCTLFPNSVGFISCTQIKCVCVNIILVVESRHVNSHIRHTQCAEIQCLNQRLSMCNVLFKVVNNIQCNFPLYMLSYIRLQEVIL